MATPIKSKNGKYGKVTLASTTPVRWDYDAMISTEVGDYHYYWRIFKEKDGLFLIHEYSYMKSLRNDLKKDVRAFPTLTQAIQYADETSKRKSEDAVKEMYRVFGKKKEDMHPFGL
ncbi:MAG: hypothetical protein IIY21_06040 [Clostridiales bacterium]|nr:hypothetical protein [Clostridiales bacterium]